jgi:type IV secretory pathway TrbF-like protein
VAVICDCRPLDRVRRCCRHHILAVRPKFVPYIIEVDKLGEAFAVGPAQLAAPADARAVRASLASFISAYRLATLDLELQRRAIFWVYGMLKTKDPATTKMDEFLNGMPETSPFSCGQNHAKHGHQFGVADLHNVVASRLARDDPRPRWGISG